MNEENGRNSIDNISLRQELMRQKSQELSHFKCMQNFSGEVDMSAQKQLL